MAKPKPKRRPATKAAAPDPAADQVYGRLTEGTFIAGFSFERACTHLEYLLEGDRWRLGGRFDDVDGFLASIKLDQFRLLAEQRKRIAKRIKELQPATTQRAIAKVVGAAKATVQRDLGPNGPPRAKKANEIKAPAERSGPSGPEAARMIERRSVTTEDKKERRAERERDLGAKQQALPDRRYGVILCDNEWKFETYSEAGMDRSADNHYPTSALDDIKARDVLSIAADDCVLFFWRTAPMSAQAHEVIEAWGFRYVSEIIWNKDRIGTGYWSRNKHEVLMIATRGNPPAPAMGTQFSSVIEAPVGRHSAKPEVFIEMIESYFPNLPKIELNRRGPARPGWDAWGNEAELPLAAE